MSVQLPIWALPNNISNYKIIQSYVADTILNAQFIKENPSIRVLNWIDTTSNPSWKWRNVASSTAIDLAKYSFTIFDVWNAEVPIENTTIVTNWSNRDASVKRLLTMFPYAIVTQNDIIIPDWPSLTLTIWNDYIANTKTPVALPEYMTY
jgi:hypothetical protein